ncbi:MAG: hypothetical protein IJL78_02415, partial [Lachnospiraceae bacterium]|nr:hypothetical protein [Lachnospiraceae bacterium]
DAEGRPFLMRVYTENNTTPSDYYYLYNGQGDVTGLIDSSNSTVVHYTYDSWGKMVSVTDTTSASISTLNPFRYRGYIYDPETELYYLQSRYYDAELGRFISPEPNAYAGSFDIGAGIRGYNVYSYCANDPVNHFDPTGEFLLALAIGALVGAVIGGTVGGVIANQAAKSSGMTGTELKDATIRGVLKGAAIGGIAGGLIGATGSVLISADYGLEALLAQRWSQLIYQF